MRFARYYIAWYSLPVPFNKKEVLLHLRVVNGGRLATPSMQDEKTKNRFLKRVFRGGVKFMAIGIAGLLPVAVQLSAVITSEPNMDYDLFR